MRTNRNRANPNPYANAPPTPTSTPFPEIDLDMDLPEGDAEKGSLTAIRYGCFGCHVDELHLTYAPHYVSLEGLPDILE